MIGTEVTPTIRLVRQLGQGGMGAVWVADNAALRTQVVVKFMNERLAGDPESVARFSREAESAATVRSPHVVQIFDHGVTAEGQPFIVMELLEGRDLGDQLALVGRLSPSQVSSLLTQAAKALSRAHAQGIVHRDIKPENIFLCDVDEGEIFVKLLDFGLAKRVEERLGAETRTGVTIGTPFYMSPEQIVRPKAADARADLWALAVVAFEALTGKRPFEGETIGAVAVALHTLPRPVPSQVDPSLPPAIDAWFARAFEEDPERRFPDALTMAEAFRAAAAQQDDGPASARTHDFPISVHAPASQTNVKPLLVACTIAVALALGVGITAPRPPVQAAAAPNDAPMVTADTERPPASTSAPSASTAAPPKASPRPASPKPKVTSSTPKPAASAVLKKKYDDIE